MVHLASEITSNLEDVYDFHKIPRVVYLLTTVCFLKKMFSFVTFQSIQVI